MIVMLVVWSLLWIFLLFRHISQIFPRPVYRRIVGSILLLAVTSAVGGVLGIHESMQIVILVACGILMGFFMYFNQWVKWSIQEGIIKGYLIYGRCIFGRYIAETVLEGDPQKLWDAFWKDFKSQLRLVRN